MTDGRSGGAPPPMPGPPPLVPEPPPVAGPPPAAEPRPRGFWMTMFGLGFAAGAGVTLLFLWFTGPIGSWRAPAARGGVTNMSGTSGTNLNASTPAVTPQVPVPPPAQTGSAPSAASLEGT